MAEIDGREAFLEALRELGGSAGNGRLRDALGWPEDAYDEIKQSLVTDGRIVPGRGRGGSVSIAGETTAASLTPPAGGSGSALLQVRPIPRNTVCSADAVHALDPDDLRIAERVATLPNLEQQILPRHQQGAREALARLLLFRSTSVAITMWPSSWARVSAGVPPISTSRPR